jgi:tetratricopeptide (TPR) repeat protein
MSWRVAATVVATAAAAGVAYVFFVAAGSQAWVDNANIVGGVAGALSLVVSIVALAFPPALRRRRVEPEPAPAPAQFLAEQVRAYWTREAQTRGVMCDRPIAVRWRWGGPDIAVPPGEVRGLDVRDGRQPKCEEGLDSGQDLADGVITDLHDRIYLRLVRGGGHLVLIGDAGAGKTAAMILLLLEGLTRQAGDDGLPAPVLLPVGEWDPKTPLSVWAASRLVEDFPQLQALPGGEAAVVDLISARRLALFLDGFDEMPGDVQAAALRGIGKQAVDVAVVLTSRVAAYRRADAAGGLDSPAVVELLTPDTEERDRFLVRGSTAARSGWQAVVKHLNEHDSCQLAKALTTPLALSLARDGYAQRPESLLDLETTGTAEEIDESLLAQVMVHAYPAGQERQRERARYWLSWLARRMSEQRELRWWLIATWFPRWQLQFATGIVVAPLFALPVGAVVWWGYGSAAGLGAGLLAAIAGAVSVNVLSSVDPAMLRRPGVEPVGWSVRLPRMRWLSTPQRLARISAGITGGVLMGVACAWAVSLRSGSWSLPVVELFLAMGTLAGVGSLFELRTWQRPVSSGDDRTPMQTYRGDLRRTLLLSTGGVVIALLVATLQSWAYSQVAVAWGGSTATARAVHVAGAAVLIVLAVSAALSNGPGAGLKLALAGVVSTVQDWGQDRINLAAFLEQAATRNVLYRNGALYQFRHAALQSHLAGYHPAAPATHRPLPALPMPIPDNLAPAQIRTRAHQLVEAGDYEEALRWYLRLGSDDMDSSAYQDLGDLHWQRGERHVAEAAYWQAVECDLARADDEVWDTFVGQAGLKLQLLHKVNVDERLADSDRWDTAEAAAATAYALRVLGNIRAWHTDRVATVRTLRRSLQYRPEDPDTWRCLGDVYLDGKDHRQAQHCYRQALRYRPHDPLAHRGLGEALHRTGQDEQATVEDEAALTAARTAPKPLFSAWRRAQQMADRSTSPRVRLLHDHSRAAHVLGELLAIDGLFTEAAEQLNTACALYRVELEQRPGDGRHWQWYGDACRTLGVLSQGVFGDDWLADAAAAYTRAYECGVADPRMTARHASVCYLFGDVETAEALAGRALRAAPVAEGHCCLGDIHNERGELTAAETQYRAALSAGRTYAAAWQGLAATLFELHRTGEAVQAYRKALELEPRSSVTLLGLGEALLEDTEPDAATLDEAIGCLRAATTNDTKDAWFTDTVLATALQLAGQPAAAQEAALRLVPHPIDAVQQDPARLTTPGHLEKKAGGDRRRRFQRAQEAVAWHRVRTEPTVVQAWQALGAIRLLRGRARGALAVYESARRRFPDDPVLTSGEQATRERLRSRQ